MNVYIPPKKNISKTDRDDPVFWHYVPLIGYVYKKRLFNTLTLLSNKYENLLEVGYGSGILFPELSKRAKQVFGLEIHKQEDLVSKMLNKENIPNVILKPGSIFQMPFSDDFFDCVVSVSTLEHLDDLDRALQEIRRVLKPKSEAILSFPVRNIVTDWFYKLLNYQPRKIHPSGHSEIIRAAKKYFQIEKIVKFPNFSNINWALYCSLRGKKQ